MVKTPKNEVLQKNGPKIPNQRFTKYPNMMLCLEFHSKIKKLETWCFCKKVNKALFRPKFKSQASFIFVLI
jgi:hypothetical protein